MDVKTLALAYQHFVPNKISWLIRSGGTQKPRNRMSSTNNNGLWFETWQAVNTLAPGRCGSNFKSVISEHMLWMNFMSTFYEIALGVSDECHITPLMVCQHWSRQWLGTVRQPMLTQLYCCHMAPQWVNHVACYLNARRFRHKVKPKFLVAMTHI